MENRGIFTLDGITGMLIATLLLLGILAYLTVLALGAQQNNAATFYTVENEKELKMISAENAKHRVIVQE